MFFYFCIYPLFSVNVEKIKNEVKLQQSRGEYNKSQDMLLGLLETNLSDYDRVEINIILSETYKRVYDYESVIDYLLEAEEHALLCGKDKEKALYRVKLMQAFAYFDMTEYKKAAKLMAYLAKKNYPYTEGSERAILIMQEGYLHYLKKEYEKAEDIYILALNLMEKTDSCNSTIIFVKQMQLYDAINQPDKMMACYRQSMNRSNNCNVIKYKVYATEELVTICRKRNETSALFKYQYALDSLKIIFNKDKHVSDLHLGKEDYLKSLAKETKKKWYWYALGAVLFILLLVSFIIILYNNRIALKQKKQDTEKELEQIKKELIEYTKEYTDMAQENSEPSEIIYEKHITPTNVEKLSQRQLEILELMRQSYTNKEIAEKLFISENTVKYHIKNIYAELDIKRQKGRSEPMARKRK